jgi:hypothetical protein
MKHQWDRPRIRHQSFDHPEDEPKEASHQHPEGHNPLKGPGFGLAHSQEDYVEIIGATLQGPTARHQQADTFWEYVLSFIQGLFWPAWMVYEVFAARRPRTAAHLTLVLSCEALVTVS